MATNATQKTGEAELNDLNVAMRSQPWYQQFFQQRGLNQDNVKLNESQRAQLAQLANANGYKIGDRMKIDEAGNVNQKGGFAGMPTWAKVAITAAAIAGTGGALGAAGVGPMAGMFGGGAPTVSGALGAAGSMAVPELGISAIPSVLGTGAGLSGAGAGLGTAGAWSAGGGLTGGLTAGTGAKAATGGSTISKLLGGKSQDLADAGKLFQNFANDEAGERYASTGANNSARHNYDSLLGNLTQGYDQLGLASAANRRTDESDAMKKLSQTGYIKSGGAPFDASKIQLSGGRSLPSFNFPRAPITDEMKAGASTLEEQLLKRLQPGGSFAPTPIDQYKPQVPEDVSERGVGEQIGRFGSLATTGLGLLSNYMGRK